MSILFFRVVFFVFLRKCADFSDRLGIINICLVIGVNVISFRKC